MTVISFPYRHTHDSEQIANDFFRAGHEILSRLPKSREAGRLYFDFECINLATWTVFGFTAEEGDEDESGNGAAFKIEYHLPELSEWEHFYALKALWEQRIAFFCTLAAAAARCSENTTPKELELLRPQIAHG